jgi:nitrogen regulatory protein PII 1
LPYEDAEEVSMKMVVAIVRPERLREVEESLKTSGFPSLTEFSVRGRGKQKGITIGDMRYDKLPKSCVVMVCRDEDTEEIIEIIIKEGKTGNIGDGKIFVLNVDDTVTIRTGLRGNESV